MWGNAWGPVHIICSVDRRCSLLHVHMWFFSILLPDHSRKVSDNDDLSAVLECSQLSRICNIRDAEVIAVPHLRKLGLLDHYASSARAMPYGWPKSTVALALALSGRVHMWHLSQMLIVWVINVESVTLHIRRSFVITWGCSSCQCYSSWSHGLFDSSFSLSFSNLHGSVSQLTERSGHGLPTSNQLAISSYLQQLHWIYVWIHGPLQIYELRCSQGVMWEMIQELLTDCLTLWHWCVGDFVDSETSAYNRM